MRDGETIVALRLWLGTHVALCQACGVFFEACPAARAAEHFMLELGAIDTSPLAAAARHDDEDEPAAAPCGCRVCTPGTDATTVTISDVREHVQRHRDGSCECEVCVGARG